MVHVLYAQDSERRGGHAKDIFPYLEILERLMTYVYLSKKAAHILMRKIQTVARAKNPGGGCGREPGPRLCLNASPNPPPILTHSSCVFPILPVDITSPKPDGDPHASFCVSAPPPPSPARRRRRCCCCCLERTSSSARSRISPQPPARTEPTQPPGRCRPWTRTAPPPSTSPRLPWALIGQP